MKRTVNTGGRLALLALLFLADFANGACRFADPPVVACYDPVNAATAFRVYGKDLQAVSEHEARSALKRSGCVPGTTAGLGEVAVSVVQRVGVKTKYGPTKVSYINVGGNHLYVADGYLTGCGKQSPHTATAEETPTTDLP